MIGFMCFCISFFVVSGGKVEVGIPYFHEQELQIIQTDQSLLASIVKIFESNGAVRKL